ncbi:hypothetical protein BC939DRAFT_478693 [Gamsiella multidivaricata]|uniref:uncharacterized protein n=1 Tax=Gamsiella multidivaricata TaxID=101098 RepID=UPI002220CE07|nr:uncharacterized protein BC939DRAFT_478693 [Gamsiella multidivaricata]KAG0371314.1 hypothetical protein BGZ54_006603 [Gamsiella multidivaricata]KAI7820820.1 hypothetical protein BC939DRAFT_478693 [Gamsiella multidivaricata]
MKWDHDSDSEDIVMADESIEELTTVPATLKQHSVALCESATSYEAETVDSSCSSSVKVSHTAVETDIPLENTPPSSRSSSISSIDEPLTPTSEFGSGASKTGDAQAPKSSLHDKESGYPYSRSAPWSYSSSYSASNLSMSSLIQSKESVYAAVPVSSELYIIPKSSSGFYWNGDLFLKPHQRRSLGVDHMFNSVAPQHYGFHDNSNSIGSGSHVNGQQQNHHPHSQDTAVIVHDILLTDVETARILPSWP